VRFRKLAVVAVAALAVTGLAGCNTKVGAAAVVDGHRISDSDVTKYLTPKAKPFQLQNSSGTSQTIEPRSYVLQTYILGRLFRCALAATTGGLPTEAELAAADKQITQSQTPAQTQAQYTKYGFKASFAALDIRNSTYEAVLAQRLNATTDAGPILNEIKKLKMPVSVSARYGSWDASTLSLSSGPTDGLPSFVTLEGGSSAAATPSS
jgi:predicted small secreted protein